MNLRLLSVLILFLPIVSVAQTRDPGAIRGRITDPSGALVPHAQIVITNELTGARQTVASDTTGAYEAAGLPLGATYAVRVTHKGFAPAERTGIPVEAERPTTVDLSLKVSGEPEQVEVTATKLPEDPNKVPAAVQVFSGDELRGRGARDLPGALSQAIGVEVAPGGDAGPAGSVPEFWGLKEFDAFLLIVDGVPFGGAFNPALTSLELSDVERIEVLRGPAPVTYGATSFVGVVHVVHKDPESPDRDLALRVGSLASGGGSFSTPLPLSGDWASRLTLAGEREGYSDDRTSYARGYGSWRVARKGADSRLWFNADLNWLDQDPASPRPRDGAVLSPDVPVDANHNPAGAFLNDHRGTVTGGFDRPAGHGRWSLLASLSHDSQDAFRGFLQDLANAPDNAHGFREQIQLTDVYVDSHLSWKLPHRVELLAGGDFLHGTGNAQGADFDYTVPLNGATATVVTPPATLDVHIADRRNFAGLYGEIEWSPLERLRFDAGIRLNITAESRTDTDAGAGTSEHAARTQVRPGASLGAIFTAWQRDRDSLRLFVNYRDTFKPAAIDFGIGESGGGALLLQPETARSVEGGLKGSFFNRRLDLDVSGFLMNFNNLVTSTTIGGLPALINAGKERFQGFEGGASLFLLGHLIARATYSFHDDRFTDFVQDFGGVPTQLAGNRLEMSPRHLAAVGVSYVPRRGFLGGVSLNYTGNRYLNMRNTALAPGFVSVGVSAGYRTPRWELRADASNLNDHRDPVAESEVGDAQYYLLPARRVDVTWRLHF